uniref:Calcium-channel protein CCH1 n=1 Tax=Schizophyllum commune (strain H4-8 / FGSC 9210) TaxID=578458 RepID=D8Q6Y7_SCHCM
MDGQREDDEAGLAANASGAGWDTEASGSTPRAQRRTVRYSVSPSPLRKTGTAIKSVSRNLRRASLRVVNLAGQGLESQIRLPDGNGDEPASAAQQKQEQDDAYDDQIPDLTKALPIRGRTLGFLGTDSKLRLNFYRMLVYPWTEPFILLLIIINAVVLTIQASRSLTLSDDDDTPAPVTGYFHSWEDYALFGLFVFYTVEAFARICVSGFLLDPEIPTSSLFTSPFTSDEPQPVAPTSNLAALARANSIASQHQSHGPLTRGLSITQRIKRLNRNLARPFALASRNKPEEAGVTTTTPVTEKIKAVAQGFREPKFFKKESDAISLPFRLSVTVAHEKTYRNLPYLRQSWNRIDMLAIDGQTFGYHVGYYVSIIGVQSFSGSLRRACYLQPVLGEDEMQLDDTTCGGYVDPDTLNEVPYIMQDGQHSNTVKGYVCPLGQICRESDHNPYSNIESFDTIYYAALQVTIVASANGWTPLMYNMIDSEYFVSCFFFIICVIVLNFWLINLFVAVITNTFAAIRKETKHSAFGAAPLRPIADDDEDGWAGHEGRRGRMTNPAKTIYEYTRYVWVLLALASLILQASRTTEAGEAHSQVLYYGELGITIAFDVEIGLRVLATLPDWRDFFRHGQNWLDTAIAVVSTIIQIPAIHNSALYPWFTAVQLMRFYRVILVVPRMKPLLLAVFGNMYGLANMTLFLILVNFIAALFALQLLRGDVSGDNTINFGQLFNAFLGIYQVFSSENWTDVLYTATDSEMPLGQAAVVALFVTVWLLFANFIILQMFIAVINENFDVAEEAKLSKQASNYWASHQPERHQASWFRRLNPYRWVRANPVKVKVENLPSNLVLPMQKALVQDYTVGTSDTRSVMDRSIKGSIRGKKHYPSKSLSALQKLFAGDTASNDVPMSTLKHARSETLAALNEQDDEAERHLELLAAVNTDNTAAEDMNDALYERKAQKADFIRDHPTYDKTFWLFSQKNPLRRWCQKVVEPANGERIFGQSPSPIAHPIFQLILLLAVAGGIAVEIVATPLYRRDYYAVNGQIRGSWFDICEAAFGFTLVIEFCVKIIADGFLFTPNAYIRSIWNILDFFIMIGVLLNVITGLIFIGGLSRFTRSLKALRVLRLVTLIEKMRSTFQSLIISGATRIFDAAVLAILYMIPYAVWGLNMFSGKMNTCNDEDVDGMADCIGEYTTTAVGDSFGFLAPRSWDNPAPSTVFSFDSFPASLLILFEIVSLEGWTDVMGVAMSITGENSQPQTNASQVNALFFIIYNLLGGVVILTLFVSIIIGNFSSKTGSAFLTKPQREWIDLQKLFKRQRPSKRPKKPPTWAVRRWCFDRATQKHGWWSRSMTFLFFLHIVALMTQSYTRANVTDTIRNDFFLAITFIYIIDVLVRFIGLGWLSFRANGWNIFDIIVAVGSFITTLIVRFGESGFVTQQLQKLFLVSIAFKLVQRTNSLNKLFKTAVSSLPVILSLLGLWFILFIFFAILFVEVFSMTKWGSGESRDQNYMSVGSALVMLAFMSTGEGWNQYMHDYAVVYPRCTNSGSEGESDCGSVGWAFVLFIAWNLLSMYIFLNMFTGVVVENFSYVFQTTTGGAKSVTREEMRAFKKIWAQYSNPKTGYLEKQNFVPFFGKLSGIFEVRIYPQQYSIPNIINAAKESSNSEYAWPSLVVDGIDIGKLNKVLNEIDYAAIRRRRVIYSRLYHEASISHHGRGISFTDMLLLLAHHKLIVDREALVLKDLVKRTETNKLVTDLVNLDRVRSLLKTITYRRRFLAHKRQLQAERYSQQDIPSIVVDTLPTTPPSSSRDIASALQDTPGSPSPSQRRATPDVSLALEGGPGLQRSRGGPRWTSDTSFLSGDLGYLTRDSVSVDEDPQGVINAMQNSMWGDMLDEAAEEEEEKR